MEKEKTPWFNIPLVITDSERLDWLNQVCNNHGIKSWTVTSAYPSDSIRDAIDDTIKFQRWQAGEGRSGF